MNLYIQIYEFSSLIGAFEEYVSNKNKCTPEEFQKEKWFLKKI